MHMKAHKCTNKYKISCLWFSQMTHGCNAIIIRTWVTEVLTYRIDTYIAHINGLKK